MGFMRDAKHRIGYRALAPMYDKVLTVSEEVRRFSIEQDRLAPSKVSTLYNAVDLARVPGMVDRSEIRERLGLKSDSPVIVSVGNLRRLKGFDVLVRAAAIVYREFPKAVFVVAGGQDPHEPECLRELEKLRSELGIAGNVKFLGSVEDVLSLLKACDAFCLLSRTEGFSNALLEAMACGIPCVATRVGGNSEALGDGHSGLLVESEDHESAAVQICKLLQDKKLAQCLGERGQNSISERFTPEVVMAQLAGIYDALLTERKRTANRA
jgi:glycosyltransferase involved in cell wall biosynthesis